MARKFVYIIVGLAVALTAFFGIRWYLSAQNTPEKRTESFLSDLLKGETDKTYERFTDKYKKSYTKSKWNNYVQYYVNAKSDQKPVLQKQEQVTDTFNIYPDDGEPTKFIYKLRFDNKDYIVTIVTYRQGDVWVIDSFQGDYR